MKWRLIKMVRMVRSIVICSMAFSIASITFAQTNYVQKTGDTMSGTLSVEAQPYPEPTIELLGPSSTYKFLHFVNTTDGALWDLSMDAGSESNRMTFYYSPDGINWTTPFFITTNGVLHGNGAGLSNLNVTVAIPDGTIALSKLAEPVLTDAVFTEGSISSMSVGNLWGMVFPQDVGDGCMAVGGLNTASNYSFVSGWGSVATGHASHAEGESAKAYGYGAHAEGGSTEASGKYSHAEGYSTKAQGYPSHAEGYLTKATGSVSHSEGHTTIASGLVSHAEGYLSEARANITHAAGFGAIADHDHTFVWSSNNAGNDMAFASTTNKQFSVYAENGIRLITGSSGTVEVAGRLVGDGSGLTGIKAAQVDLSNIGVYGDISMGSFTNTTVSN